MAHSINPYQLITEYSACQKSGCLNIQSNSATWRVYFKNGDLVYADTSLKNLAFIQFLLLKNGWNDAIAVLKKMPNEELSGEVSSSKIQVQDTEFDQALAWLWLHESLAPDKILHLVEEISQDALETLFWVTEGKAAWQDQTILPSWIQSSLKDGVTLDLADIIKYLQQRATGWKSCSEFLTSPHQRPYLLDFRDIGKEVEGGSLSADALEKLAAIMRKGLSLRELSIYLKQDELHVAQLLSPYIQEKIIHLRSPQPPYDALPNILRDEKNSISDTEKSQDKIYKVACIDDSPTVLSEMKRFLGEEKFDVSTIEDPVQAAATIFKLKPDIILMDITMPKINGYKLCSLLRSSSAFDNTPIIMVSGNKGLIDKARAKISGATDYLTKPFDKLSLTSVIQKHLYSA
ncbi:MAG: response regulator [Acaryochloridaceae cyanobacterium RL_2_7]|nr:response regulator [Acaryochloridaceae cyanobacterium RL_2_7]